MVAAGDFVHVLVNATDNISVASVTANGTALIKADTTTWEGNLTASALLGTHTVTVVAVDSVGNTSNNSSSSYKTAQVIGMSCADITDPVTRLVKDNYLFKFWGKVSMDTDGFWLDDGALTRIKVIAPEYSGIEDGDFASARGILDPDATPPTLTCTPFGVTKLQ
jgi:hypothetical protein